MADGRWQRLLLEELLRFASDHRLLLIHEVLEASHALATVLTWHRWERACPPRARQGRVVLMAATGIFD